MFNILKDIFKHIQKRSAFRIIISLCFLAGIYLPTLYSADPSATDPAASTSTTDTTTTTTADTSQTSQASKTSYQNIWIWDNSLGNSIWGASGTKSQYNWDRDTAPETIDGYPPIVVFYDEYVKSNQKILLQDSDKLLHSLYFLGSYNYTLYTDTSNKKIIFDTNCDGKEYSVLALYDYKSGGGTQSIQTEVEAKNDLFIYNSTKNTFSLDNLLNMNSYALTIDALGDVTLNSLKGDGSLYKQGSGNLIMSGSSIDFKGSTVINEGILKLQHAQGLGADRSGEVTVCDGASLELFNTGSVAYKTLTLNGEGLDSTGALRNTSGNNTWTGAVNLTSTASVGVSGGQLTISGNISGSGGLTKVGPYTLILSGNNTFTDQTTVNGGTLILNGSGSNKALGGTSHVVINSGGTVLFCQNNQINSAANLTLNGGTLNTGGFSQTLNVMTFSANSTLILGSGPLHVSDVIRTGGILTVSNYSSMGQLVATPGSIDQNTLNHIYFADQGITGAFHLSNGCIVPAPEPGTYGAILILASTLAWHTYRRRQSLLSS